MGGLKNHMFTLRVAGQPSCDGLKIIGPGTETTLPQKKHLPTGRAQKPGGYDLPRLDVRYKVALVVGSMRIDGLGVGR